MRYFGIQCPDNRIWWIAEDSHRAWRAFFTDNAWRAPMAEAIKAYEATGYRCVEVAVSVIPNDEIRMDCVLCPTCGQATSGARLRSRRTE